MTIATLGKMDFRPLTHDAAADLFSRKTTVTPDQFSELSKVNRARAFTVANVHRARTLQAARDVVHKAIAKGTPVRNVIKDLEALLGKEGIPKIARARLRSMFRQNAFTAYSVARRRTLEDPDVVKAFGYWQYLTVGNGNRGVNNVRDRHAELHGKVFARDDPFWNHFYPPWEWGCRCFVRALTGGQVKRGKMVVWTYRGGSVRPVSAKRKSLRIKPHPTFDFPRDVEDPEEFDLSRLDAELRRVVEAA